MEEVGGMDFAQRGVPMRVIQDEDGQTWTVREFVRVRNGLEDRSLLFDCGMAIRRVRDFPEAWESLGDDELLQLSRRR